MKLVAVSLAAAALLVTGAAAAATPRPPQIKETFTKLPCPAKPKTTLQLMGCAGKRIMHSDEEINKRVRAVWTLLKTAAPRTRFVAAERAWFAFRRAFCLSRADVFAGGTLAKVQYAECVGDVNRTHARELQQFQKALTKK